MLEKQMNAVGTKPQKVKASCQKRQLTRGRISQEKEYSKRKKLWKDEEHKEN
jgi:hypothetical protein